MRNNLNQNKKEYRPKSQNDINNSTVNGNPVSQNTVPDETGVDEEIDKEQFLEIIQVAYQKILASLNPRVSLCLNQIRQMYDHFIE